MRDSCPCPMTLSTLTPCAVTVTTFPARSPLKAIGKSCRRKGPFILVTPLPVQPSTTSFSTHLAVPWPMVNSPTLSPLSLQKVSLSSFHSKATFHHRVDIIVDFVTEAKSTFLVGLSTHLTDRRRMITSNRRTSQVFAIQTSSSSMTL